MTETLPVALRPLTWPESSQHSTPILGVPSRLVVVAGRVGAGVGPVTDWLRRSCGFAHAHVNESTVAVACTTGRQLSELLKMDALAIVDDDGISVSTSSSSVQRS